MRIDRKLPSNLTISELQSQRGSAIRPEEAAADAMRPYAALTDAAASAGKAVAIAQERDRLLTEKENRRKGQLAELNTKLKITEWENSPLWNEQEVDGIPTQEYMRDKWLEITAELKQPLAHISDKGMRAHLEDVISASIDIAGVSASNQVAARRKQTDMEISWDFTRIAADNGDWEMVDSMMSEMLDNKYITQPQYDSMTANFEADKSQQIADEIVGNLHQAYLDGTGEEMYARLAENPHEDEATQNRIISGANAVASQFHKIEMNQADAEIAGLLDTERLIEDRLAKEPTLDLDALRDAGDFGSNEEYAARMHNRLRDVQRSALNRTAKGDNVRDAVSTGFNLTPTAAHREGLDVVMQERIDAGSLDPDNVEAVADYYRGVALVGKYHSEQMAIGATDVDSLIETNRLWRATRQGDPHRWPDTGLSNEKETIHRMMAERVDSMGDRAAAETVLELTREVQNNPQKHEVRRNQFLKGHSGMVGFLDVLDTGELTAQYKFNEMRREHYDPDGFFNMEPFTAEDFANYLLYYEDGFMLTGNPDEAAEHADSAYQRSHPMNNINSPDGDNWAEQDAGVKGDATQLRRNYLNEIKGQEFSIWNENTQRYHAGIPDPDLITFERSVRSDRGITYQIEYDGKPMSTGAAVDAYGDSVGFEYEVTFTNEDLAALAAFTDSREQQRKTEQQINDTRKLEDTYIERAKEYERAGQETPAHLQLELDNIPKQRAGLEKVLATERIKFSEEFPDFGN